MSDISVTVDTKKKTLTIVLPLQKPTPSASGKNLTVSTTRGNLTTDVEIDGKPVTIGVNAYIRP